MNQPHRCLKFMSMRGVSVADDALRRGSRCITNARSAGGFTLIELLVVISIISLLVALLLPSLAKARDSARKIKCATQARQINFAIQLYGQDHKGWFPIIYRDYGNVFHNGNSSNPAMIRNYFGKDTLTSSADSAGMLGVGLCPNRDPAVPDRYAGYDGRKMGTTYRIVAGVGTLGYSHWSDPNHAYTDTSYSPDGHVAWYGWLKNVASGNYNQSSGTPVPREFMIGNTPKKLPPSDQPMLGDIFNNTATAPDAVLYPQVGNSWGGGIVRQNHLDGLNVAFADGHVKWRNKDDLSRWVQFFSSDAHSRLWW